MLTVNNILISIAVALLLFVVLLIFGIPYSGYIALAVLVLLIATRSGDRIHSQI